MNCVFRQTALAVLVVCITGCAAKPVEDTSPLVRTAIIKTQVSNSGIKGQFGHQGNSTLSTTADIQRRDDAFKYTGSIMSRIGGQQNRSNIVRLDKAVEWSLDNKKKRYSECPLGGCPTRFDSFLSGEYEQEAEGDFEENNSCQLTDITNTFDVRQTGQSRVLNGFNAVEYLIDWRMSASDTEGKTLENIIEINIWTTPQTPEIAEALRMQKTFDQKYAVARGETYPDNIQKALPREVIDLFAKFLLDSFTDAELAKMKNLMANSGSIEGFPVSRKIKWNARNETCSAPPAPEAEDDSRLNTSSLSGLLQSVGKKIIDQEVDKKVEEKKREIALAPIMLFVEDVQSIEISEIRESRLSVPSNYKLITRN